MGRQVRDARLETRTARTKLSARGKPYFKALDPGLHLGYRKGKRGGKWLVRRLVRDDQYNVTTFATADDKAEPDGVDVLSFSQAQAKARELITRPAAGPYTVRRAMDDYLEWYEAHNRPSGLEFAKYTINAHILPTFGDTEIADLTTDEIRKWHQSLAKKPARIRPGLGKKQTYRAAPATEDERRKRRATANRILTTFKAALNRAHREHPKRVPSDGAWRRVEPFKRADAPTIRYLSTDECQRLINACDPDFRRLVEAALLTGARYGELIAMRCDDYNADAGTVTVREAKGGKPRHIPLNAAGVAMFERVTAGRAGGDTMFLRDDGEPWARSQQARRLNAAAEAAKIKEVSFHILRHTYGSTLAMRGVPMGVIGHALGHADTRMTEKHYAHLAPSYVAETIRKHLPDFGITPDKKVAKLGR